MTREEAVWHANHVFNIVIERCINAQNLKDAREFDEAKQIVIEALEQEPIIHCKDCKYWQDNNNGYPVTDCRWNKDETPDADDYCSYAERMESDGE